VANFTDIFIRRPVLAIVISLLIMAVGVRAFQTLPIRQYPRIVNGMVIVNTTYYGADPDVVAGFITAPLENAISQVNGIDYITSTSGTSTSSINATLRLNYDPNTAAAEITSRINSVMNQLPPGTQQPVMRVQLAQGLSPVIVTFWSETMPLNKITDYLNRVIVPKFQAIPGVQTANLMGAKNVALRAWIDPNKLAAYGLTQTEVNQAMAGNNYLSGLGTTKGQMVQTNLNASTNLSTLEDFQNLSIKQINGATIRLKDIAEVSLGADDYESGMMLNGRIAVMLQLDVVPTANMLDVAKAARELVPQLKEILPPQLNSEMTYDASLFVNASIDEVNKSLIESLIIVALVVFVFLGSVRSVMIPLAAIPLSLIGTFAVMLAFGFTINLLTLLALVLAIGLVVDDAIIVVENVNRYLEEGKTPFEAALMAARELGGPIIAMAAVLVAVYVPVGFQSGMTGALFTEFAFTLAGSVIISSIVALTLSPMMCSRLLQPHSMITGWQGRFIHAIDDISNRLSTTYRRFLHDVLDNVLVVIVFALIVLSSIYYLYTTSRSELAPQEDQGMVMAQLTVAPNATLQQRMLYADQLREKLGDVPGAHYIFQMMNNNNMNTNIRLKPWDDRDVTADEVQVLLQNAINSVPGVRGGVSQPPALPGGFGSPVQFVVGSTEGFDRMLPVMTNFVQEARQSGLFSFIDMDLKIDLPRATLEIDRGKAAQMGLRMSDVGSALSALLGGGYVNYFVLEGRSYKVIPQVEQQYRLNSDQLLNYYIKAPDGTTVPLSTIAKIVTKAVPQSYNHFQMQNAVQVRGSLTRGVTMGEGLAKLREIAQTLPLGYTVDYGGQSRQFMQESTGFATTFAFALVVIFLVLAALFESFRDPLIILVSVPMSIAGALIFINLGVGGATLNIYTQVGLVTLMGLVSKHGILIVRFANELQMQGHSKREAIEMAAEIRLRPILMTTFAMALGVLPLLMASGAGAASRYNMGLVIFTGVSIGTLFTLFVVPGVYLLLGADHAKKVTGRAAQMPAPAE